MDPRKAVAVANRGEEPGWQQAAVTAGNILETFKKLSQLSADGEHVRKMSRRFNSKTFHLSTESPLGKRRALLRRVPWSKGRDLEFRF